MHQKCITYLAFCQTVLSDMGKMDEQTTAEWLMLLFPLGRSDSKEMLYEEVKSLVVAIGSAHRVVLTGQKDKIEVFVGLDERVDYLHCG